MHRAMHDLTLGDAASGGIGRARLDVLQCTCLCCLGWLEEDARPRWQQVRADT
jgi:hypothetical protein